MLEVAANIEYYNKLSLPHAVDGPATVDSIL